jgi:hypothetical protein
MCTTEEGMMSDSGGQFVYGKSVGDFLAPFTH